MRRPRSLGVTPLARTLRSLAALAAAALALAPRVACAAADSGPATPSTEYRLSIEALPESLRAPIGLGTGLGAGLADSARRWSGPDLESAALRLRDFLASRGDVAATVRLALTRGEGSAPGRARIEVTRIGAPEIAAAAAPAEAVLHATTPIPAALADSAAAAYRGASRGRGSVDGIAAGLSAARDALIDAGYYAAEIALDSLQVGSGAPRAHLRVAAGPPAIFEAMELPGATATRPTAAARVAGLDRGARLTPAILADTRERLVSSGLFEQVGDPRLTPGSLPGGAKVVVPVVEERSSRFEGAIGIAREGGVTGLIDLALGNIAGSGRSAGLRWFGPGDGRSEYAARYREPALFGSRADAALSLEAQVADSLFTQTRWSAEVGFAPAGATRASLAIRKSGSTYSGLARGSSSTWSLAARGSVDRLRPLQNPTRGFRAALTAEAGRRSDQIPGIGTGSERRGLFRGHASAEGVVALSPRRVLAASARATGAFLPGGDFPAEELAFVGGSEGLRGHRDRAFGGSRVAALSLEQRWITDDRGGRLYLFADAARHDLAGALAAGSVALPPSLESGGAAPSLARTVLSPGWEFGYGAGLRTRMASGLVGLELGFAPGEPLRRATIHVKYASTW
jgi:outer membrane protein assembly factor BamA